MKKNNISQKRTVGFCDCEKNAKITSKHRLFLLVENALKINLRMKNIFEEPAEGRYSSVEHRYNHTIASVSSYIERQEALLKDLLNELSKDS